MLYWVVYSIKRWTWSQGLIHIYKYVWPDFDYVCYWRMRWLLFDKCCCFCWSNSCWSVCFCREIFVDVFRRCCLDFCCVLVFNALLVVLYERIVRLKVELLLCWLRLTVYIWSCFESTLYWLIRECQILNDFWKYCSCLSARWKMLADKLLLPVFPTYLNLPLPCTYCLHFTCFSRIRFCRNTKCFGILYLWCLVLPKLVSVIYFFKKLVSFRFNSLLFCNKLINCAFEIQNLPNVYLEFVFLLYLPT